MSNDNGKVIFSLGGKKKKKQSTARTEVSAKDFGHDNEGAAAADEQEEAQRITSFDPNVKKNEKAPLVIPLTQPPNALADRIKKELGGRNEERVRNNIAEEGTAVKEEEPLENVISATVISSSNNNNNNNNNNHGSMRQRQPVSIKDHLEQEMKVLPDQANDEAYEKIPIDQFGAALLRGMGWNEADEQQQVESNQMFGNIPRPSRLGLGAIPKAPGGGEMDMPSVLTGKNKNKKKKLSEQQLVQQKEFEEKRELQRKQDKQQTMQIGSIVYLLEDRPSNKDGRQQRRAKIVQLMGVPGLNMVMVHLEHAAEPTPVKKGQLGPLVARSDMEQEPFVLPKPKTDDRHRRRRDDDRDSREVRRDRDMTRSPEGDKRRDRKDSRRDRSRSPDRYSRDDDGRRGDRKRDRRDRDRDEDDRDRNSRDREDRKRRDDRSGKRRRRDGSGSESDSDRDKQRRKESSRRDDRDRKRSKKSAGEKNDSSDNLLWVIPNIRVRVVTEKLGKKHFRQKGVIVDVNRRHGATLRMDILEGGKHAVLEHVPEQYLETALPKSGGHAIVLTGPHKWTKGKLLERNSKASTGSIQVFEDMSILSLSLDDMAEWCGPLDDDLG
jgi:G-patch domain/KN17 SH3-like C-terminal domain